MKRAGIVTWFLIALLVLFGVTDTAAELSGDGKAGPHNFGETFSTSLFHLEKGRWYIRAVVLVIMLVLTSHLTFGTSLLPGGHEMKMSHKLAILRYDLASVVDGEFDIPISPERAALLVQVIDEYVALLPMVEQRVFGLNLARSEPR